MSFSDVDREIGIDTTILEREFEIVDTKTTAHSKSLLNLDGGVEAHNHGKI